VNRYTLTFLLVTSVLAAGCGDSYQAPAQPAPVVTPTPTPSPTPSLTAPQAESATGSQVINTLRPTLTVKNATSSMAGSRLYDFDLADSESYNRERPQWVVSKLDVPEGESGSTSYALDFDLKNDTNYVWRSRAKQGNTIGPWSSDHLFKTFAPPPPPPPRSFPSSGGGAVAYVAARYSEYLEATGSLTDREHNMAYLRDRIIEVARCGGLDVVRNNKRGVGPWSTDAVCWRDGSRDRVMDIASGFDDYRRPLSLHWIEVSGPPGYAGYGTFSCTSLR
jgi:hypothetical protein